MDLAITATKLKQLPAGKYWVGDLCYVLDEDIGFDWGMFVSWMFDGDESGRQHEGPCMYNGIELSFHGTAYGDGCYYDQDDHQYGVDAGMIGCVRADKIGAEDKTGEYRGGHLIEFDHPFTTEYDNGTICIDHLEIPTGDDGEDDDYEW